MKREQDDISLTPEQIRKVGSVLQRLRLKGGHKLQVLATMGNISVATLSNIENGKDHVTVEKIEVYCKLLNTSLQYVLELIETAETLNSKDLRYLNHVERLIELHSPDRAEEKLIQLTFDPYDPLYIVQQLIFGKCHIYRRNWNSARKKFEYVLNQLNRHFEFDKSNLAAVCHLYLAKIAFFKDKNLIKALDHIRLGKEVYQQDGDRAGIIYNLLISEVIYLEKLDEDEDALIIVRKMQEEIGLIDHIDTKLQVYALHILLLFKKRQFKEARSYANEALEITRTCNRPEQALEIYTLLGAIYKECGDLYEAEEYYLYALDLEELVSNEHLLATPYMRLGELYSLKEDWNRAKKMLDKAEKISRETEDPFRHMEVLELYGDYYIRRNELQEAIPYYEQVWDYEERLHPEQPLPEVREKLAFCYRAVNDPKFHKIVARMLELDVQLKLKITKGVNNMPHHSMKLAGDPPND